MRDEASVRLERAGLRKTGPRIAILRVLCEATHPLSHREIEGELRETPVNKVTIYRALDTFLREGILHRVRGVDGVLRFSIHPMAGSGCPGNHPHFSCVVCGRMFCLTGQRLPWVSVPEGMRVKGKQLIVYGWCRECSREVNGEESDEKAIA